MFTLGINAAFHDCAACLVEDGVVIAAAEEERFTRFKHGKRPLPFTVWQLPFHAIDDCLRQAGIRLADVDHVAYAYDPAIELGIHRGQDRISLPLEPSRGATDGASAWAPLALSYVLNAPRHLASGAPHHLQARFDGVRHDGPFAWHFIEHHLAHQASAFLAAPFADCAVMTLDGRGERASSTCSHWQGGRLERLSQVDLPHSLGLLVEELTAHLGFLRSSDEYKVMALASFGEPTQAGALRRIVQYRGDGRFTVEPVCWPDLCGAARRRGDALLARHSDIARSMQLVLEETVLEMAHWLHRRTGSANLALAGGVALNCVMNSALRDRGPFRNVWVQPAAGDAGTALGAALWTDLQQRPGASRRWQMDDVFLGPSFGDDEIEACLRETGLPYRRVADIAAEAAQRLAEGKVLGWFQGRMEFGPRSLGARSILASPADAGMQARLNLIKDREDFRPVAPVVLENEAANWFVDGGVTPFMVFVDRVRPDKAAQIPAVRHIDGTARVQTINRSQHPLYFALLQAFQRRTGVPVLVNTSFNTRGEPIVCTPRDALASFCTTALDALAIGNFLLEKPAMMQP